MKRSTGPNDPFGAGGGADDEVVEEALEVVVE